MLPDITGHRRKPQMGESFQSMGRMTGAAGFKRDSVSSRGMPNPGLTGFTYNDPNAAPSGNRYTPGGTTQTSSFGMGGREPTDDQFSNNTGMGGGGVKPASPMKSARRSFT